MPTKATQATSMKRNTGARLAEQRREQDIRLVYAAEVGDAVAAGAPGNALAGTTRKARDALPGNGETLTCHIAALRRYARALLGNSSDVDDLVQECLARALERVRSWGRIKDVRAYLFTILHNVHVDRLSKQKRAGIAVPLEHAIPRLAVAAAQITKVEMRDLARALKLIPVDQRQVILLVGLEGITYQEVADLLGIPIGTVMSRLSRGREALRRLMAEGPRANLRMVRS